MDTKKTITVGSDLKDLSREEMLELFKKAQQNTKKKEEAENLAAIDALKMGTIPTPPEIRATINCRTLDDRQEILSKHVYWKEMMLWEGFFAVTGSLHAAYTDICKHEAAVVPAYQSQYPARDHIEYTVSNPLQKDVMAFCAAAMGIVDTFRRLRKRRTDIEDEVETLIATLFDNDLSAFIKALRNNLSHGSVTIPNWTVTHDKSGMSGSMNFQKGDLLRFGKWSNAARKYIEQTEDDVVNIRKAAEEYSENVRKFVTALNTLKAQNVSAAEQDYYDIEDAYSRANGLTWMKIYVLQIGKNRDPYDYIHRSFTAEEVRQILRLPRNSKEQVDFIIDLKRVEVDCDDELREGLYTLFGIPGFSKKGEPSTD